MDPITIGLLMGGGALLSHFGHRREANAENQRNLTEDRRVEQVDAQRAAGRAALMRGILNANGFGATMTDEQILAMLSGTRRRTQEIAKPSIFSTLGQGASRVGTSALMGSADTTTAPGAKGTDTMAQFLAAIRGNRATIDREVGTP